ncbi:MAG: YggS family pyridoxal phosphate-dependent enzyme [Lachnospiraceae bacterium]|jgi:pyridoxal phosphate enzyme (YggS family)
MIKENLIKINSRIRAAANGSRFSNKITLVAVSKSRSIEEIMQAYEMGIRDFGENRVQELCDKFYKLPDDIRWHLIGHLQRNKVKAVIDKAWLIHSVDSFRLADKIREQASAINKNADILIQVNISGEESKSGVTKNETIDLIRSVAALPNIRIRGLMTMAPICDNPEDCRDVFRQLTNLSIDINALNIDNAYMEFLSMGMSDDFEVAIDEGSNLVRIGTSIFGQRNY